MDLIIQIWPSLMNGLQTTLSLFTIVLLASLPLGLILGVLRVFGPKWLQGLIGIYIYVMRGTPLMLQLMFVFFGLPFVGISMARFSAALLAYILNYAAYFAEIFRGGINSIPAGQFEAIHVLQIGKVRGFRRIILPQVFRVVMPSVGNEVISLVKDTSLVYVIGIGELLRAGQIAVNTYATLVPFLAVGVLYLLVTGVVTFALNKVEQRVEY
ncbi:MAG: amino acid ABC transporter permease [Atopococcus tabaci]|uniref:Amino acid ABC transporter permease n=1 Tax=Atopococcus tabaci TaxID=269774 RepID=A0AA43UBR6_9LACT|nr:amino acid ABC transporter permease [Atopococcus tabaci]